MKLIEMKCKNCGAKLIDAGIIERLVKTVFLTTFFTSIKYSIIYNDICLKKKHLFFKCYHLTNIPLIIHNPQIIMLTNN